MLRIVMAAAVVATLSTAAGAHAQTVAKSGQKAQAYDVIPVSPDERSGRSRQIQCSVGQRPQTTCTFTPLFGDGSFQLDGPDIAVRMVISGGEGSLFEVFSASHRVPVGGIYVRNPRDRACWITTQHGPSPVCAR